MGSRKEQMHRGRAEPTDRPAGNEPIGFHRTLSEIQKELEIYIQEHSDAQFSHGICRDCAKKQYPGMNLYEA